jgi:putative endonuclease
MTDPRRQLGALGEQLASDHLSRLGFQILERNARMRTGELDIVAADDRTIVFCEVKTRVAGAAQRDPFESIHPRKQLQVRRLATRWLSEHTDRPRLADVRFDAIGITLDARGGLLRLEHLEGAF